MSAQVVSLASRRQPPLICLACNEEYPLARHQEHADSVMHLFRLAALRRQVVGYQTIAGTERPVLECGHLAPRFDSRTRMSCERCLLSPELIRGAI